MLDRFPTIITGSTFFVLVLAVTHEWGYFWVIGTHFQTLMSPSDYLSSGLLWLPYLGIWCFFVIALSRLQERFKQPEPPPSRYWIVNFLRSIHFYGLSIIVWALLGFLLLSTSWAPIVFAAALAYAWLLFFGHMVSGFAPVTPKSVVMLVGIGPILILGVFVWGLQAAYNDLSADPSYTLQPSKDLPARNVVVLRNLEKGVLIRAENRQIELYKWSDIASFTHTPAPWSSESYACQYNLAFFCRRKP